MHHRLKCNDLSFCLESLVVVGWGRGGESPSKITPSMGTRSCLSSLPPAGFKGALPPPILKAASEPL